MRQEEFLNVLMAQLTVLPELDQEQIKEYYGELICDGVEQGRSEQDIIAGFGPVDAISKRIMEDYGQMVTTPQRTAYEDYQSKVAVHTIRVRGENVKVIARPIEMDQARVLFKPREGIDKVTCTEQDGVFYFEHTMHNLFFWNMRSMTTSTGPIVVEVPVNFDGKLELETKNASIAVMGFEHLMKAALKTKNSRVNVEETAVEALEIETTNARIEMKHVKGSTVEALTTNGKICASQCEFREMATLSTTNAVIELEELQAEKIYLKTSNGAIKGTVAGDIGEFNINTHTTNSSSSLPSQLGCNPEKILKAETTNSKIKLAFVNE